MIDNKKIGFPKPHRTWIQHSKTLLWLSTGSASCVIGIIGLITGDIAAWLSALISLVGLIAVYSAFERLLTSYKLTSNGLVITRWNKELKVSWESVSAIDAIPTLGNKTDIGVKLIGGRRLPLITSSFADTSILNKAIIDIIYIHNPNVRINELMLDLYGRPPYGTFINKSSDS